MQHLSNNAQHFHAAVAATCPQQQYYHFSAGAVPYYHHHHHHHHHVAPMMACQDAHQLTSTIAAPSVEHDTTRYAATTNKTSGHGQRRPPCAVPGLPGKVHAVFAGELAPVFMIPREDFVSAPRGYSPATAAGKKASVAAAAGRPFELCRGFATNGVCAAARDCPHFHAVLSRSVAHAPHIRDEAAAYPPSDFFDASQLVPAQRTVPVYKSVDEQPAEPGITPFTTGDRVIEWLPIQTCLKTLAPLEKWAEHASQSADYVAAAMAGDEERLKKDSSRDDDQDHTDSRPLSEVASSHCAHWVSTGYCHFGATCRFVHAIRSASEHGNVPLCKSVLETQECQLQRGGHGSSSHHRSRSFSASLRSMAEEHEEDRVSCTRVVAPTPTMTAFRRMVPATTTEIAEPRTAEVDAPATIAIVQQQQQQEAAAALPRADEEACCDDGQEVAHGEPCCRSRFPRRHDPYTSVALSMAPLV